MMRSWCHHALIGWLALASCSVAAWAGTPAAEVAAPGAHAGVVVVSSAIKNGNPETDAARARGEATVPSLLGEEKATNPFLRADVPAVQHAVGMMGGDPVKVFAEVRHRKDVFRQSPIPDAATPRLSSRA